MNYMKTFKNGLLDENPTFVQLLGMCPTLAVTTSAINGMGMGLATTVVLIGSNLVISLLRKVIPDKIRIPAFIVIIATFVTIIDMFMHAYAYSLYKSLGLFIPLIVVNCLILGRAESYASKSAALPSIVDAVGMGLGFTGALTILGAVRELLGAGSLFGLDVMGAGFKPVLVMILPPGAFLALGLLIGLVNYVANQKKLKKIEKEAQ
ncbi:electron transport complex protein RnfE [Dethiosulfatibacter aminovorans DSM 17477]|uniref:Ion-translocating oxidoreductase complex subunit E n=1 Tax=Dethiosulfatibacter aminovorans DSM 17477 TaxID=1121476 RepID=A0A1M6KJ47_9FIRM|nr:electron transport complex subunit E [Dethiosulfatibacter aminovorans]SHJ58976.1 electron transport complex protein RnfE [Dethiosulfatibacter aminovorans DSM 17477]